MAGEQRKSPIRGTSSTHSVPCRRVSSFTERYFVARISIVSGSAPILPPPPPGYWPRPMSAQDERLWGMLAYLLSIFAGILAPLIIYFVYKERSAFVRETSREALNLQITALFVGLAGVFGLGGLGLAMFFLFPPAGIVVFILWVLFIVGYNVAVLTFDIMGAIKANSGIVYRVPCILRLVK